MIEIKLLKYIILCIPLLICSCSGVTFSDWHFPYMMEVQQGNYITNNQYEQIRNGMTKNQVAFVLEYPLSQYLFDKNRWDFNYQKYKNNDIKKSYHVIIYFDNNGKVDKIYKTGDDLFKK